MQRSLKTLLMSLAAGTLAAACATPQPARMALPAELQGVEPERIEGAGGARGGQVRLGSFDAQFQRSAERLGLFDDALSRDRASFRLSWRLEKGDPVDLSCKGRQTDFTIGIVTGAVRGWSLECRPSGNGAPATGSLRLEGRAAAAGTRMERAGSWTEGTRTFEIRSVHRIDGSPLPQSAPFGYVLSHQGTAVAAVELNGSRPRVWRVAGDAALREAVTPPLVILGLLWDPAREDRP